ncbi:hypothetical protein JCM19233_4907 [Vibrio astriarenae]|nr:hypothetical protein JCM19233_4907 [Vibrio sp. C7]
MHLEWRAIYIVTVTPMGKGISAPEFEALSFSSEVQDLEDAKKVLEEIRQISLQGVVYNAGVIAKQTTTNHTSYLNRLLKILITGRHG